MASLATALKCSAAYLAGQSDDLAGAAGSPNAIAVPSDMDQRPDGVMAFRIVDDLLAAGHIEAAKVAVRRALKVIAVE